MPSVLFVFTSADTNLKGGPTASHPYYLLKDVAKVDFAAPKGPNPPLDPLSVKMFAEDKQSIQFLNDETAKSMLANVKKLSDVDAKDYDAIFYVGGHGPVIDLPTDPINVKLASIAREKLYLRSVMEQHTALVNVTDQNGQSIFAGKRATGFSNAEDEIMGMTDAIPFLLEDKIKAVGTYEKAPEPWGVHVVVDGLLITGQNPASAAGVGKAILEAFEK
ncbi:hypothetical protein VKT23_016510 [Stygiomarasmius scandens]|uniref:D-lactate dehydratase n=1 Tax=Marasmiellus scandens TaxID=2682957 RepID=A0ABR1IUE1_9AGAR